MPLLLFWMSRPKTNTLCSFGYPIQKHIRVGFVIRHALSIVRHEDAKGLQHLRISH